MKKFLKLDIICPIKKIASYNDVHSVNLATVKGYIGIFPDHMFMISQISDGKLTIKFSENKSYTYLIKDGYLKIKNNNLLLLVDNIIDLI